MNDDIEIVIVDINSDQVKIGVKAPKTVSIHRKEIYENIKSEMKEAANSSVSKLKKIKKLDTDLES
ncbi:MAG: carbon storage regulator [Alphaproteobacteria bacterium]|nr:carbon storage regulator [Alphaproteobacteria bacterium]